MSSTKRDLVKPVVGTGFEKDLRCATCKRWLEKTSRLYYACPMLHGKLLAARLLQERLLKRSKEPATRPPGRFFKDAPLARRAWNWFVRAKLWREQ